MVGPADIELSHELDSPPWLRVESTLMATARLIRSAFDQAMEPLDLNLTTASLLAYLAEQGPLTQTVLADRMGIGRAAIGNAIDRLEERGLVQRVADNGDRRVWLTTITAEGNRVAGQVSEIDREVRARLRADINREERQQLASLLLRLQQNLVSSGSSQGNGERS